MTIKEQRDLIEQAEHVAGDIATLAAAVGVRQQTVYRWRSGTRRMHGLAVRAVLGYLSETERPNVK